MRRLKYSDVFWVFIFGSLLGFVMEGVWHFLRKGCWANRTGTLWGPFCVIYGFGAVVLYMMAHFIKTDNIVLIFVLSAIAGSMAELTAGAFQEAVFGTYSWNYSSHMLHFKGKISMEMSVMWGILGTLFIKILIPRINFVLDKINGNIYNNSIVAVFSVFMAVNLAVTGAALVRWKKRSEGDVAENVVEKFIDTKWDDERMQKTFPNMKRAK